MDNEDKLFGLGMVMLFLLIGSFGWRSCDQDIRKDALRADCLKDGHPALECKEIEP